jgi:hypothetical protein
VISARTNGASRLFGSAHYLDAIANKSKRVHRDSRRGAAQVFGRCLEVRRVDTASEGRWYHSIGDPRLSDFSGPIPCPKVGPKFD